MALQWLTDPNIQVNGRTPEDIYINGTRVAHLYKNVKITACYQSLKMFKNQSIGYKGSESETGIGCDPGTDEIPGCRDYYVDIVTGVCIKVETDVTQSDGVRLAKMNLKYYTTIGKYQYTYNYSDVRDGQWCSIDWEPAANDTLATADITQEEFNTLYNTYGEGIPTEKPGIEIWKNFPLYEVTGTSWDDIPDEDWPQTFCVKLYSKKILTLTFTDGTTQTLTWGAGWTRNNLLIDTLYASTGTHSQTYNK